MNYRNAKYTVFKKTQLPITKAFYTILYWRCNKEITVFQYIHIIILANIYIYFNGVCRKIKFPYSAIKCACSKLYYSLCEYLFKKMCCLNAKGKLMVQIQL